MDDVELKQSRCPGGRDVASYEIGWDGGSPPVCPEHQIELVWVGAPDDGLWQCVLGCSIEILRAALRSDGAETRAQIQLDLRQLLLEKMQ